MITLSVNSESRTLDVEPDMPLLRALRDMPGLAGQAFQHPTLTLSA